MAWDLDIVPLGRSLRVDAVIDDQYMDHSVKYWEGMISVIEDGEPVGRGYLEMTGY